MDNRRQTLKNEEEAIIELYKCHYSAQEAADTLGLNYGVVIYRFKGFKLAKIKKYNRLSLIPSNTLPIKIQETLNATEA